MYANIKKYSFITIVWNSLPANIRSAAVSLQTFAGRLETYLFELP